MAVSQNGWQGIESGSDERLVRIPKIIGRVRGGDVAVIFTDLVEQFDAHVEDVDLGADDWGYAYRAVRAGDSLSNHASGTAIDLNAMRHPLGKVGTFTTTQVAALRQILARYGGVVRWGGDYSGRKDEMHFEIVGTTAQVAAVAARLRGGGSSAARPITPTTSEEDDMYWLRVNNGQGRGDVYEVTAFTVDKITLQQFEDIKGVIVPRMTDATEAAVTRLAARKAALRRHIWGPDKGGR